MNVVYTSLYMTGAKDYSTIQPWHIDNLYWISQYCRERDIELRVIDNSNRDMAGLLSNIEVLANPDAIKWYAGTFCSYVSIVDFIKSDKSNMIWLDLDMFIKSYKGHLFEVLPDKFHMNKRSVDLNTPNDWAKREIKFINHYGVDVNALYNSSLIKISKEEAVNMMEFINAKEMNIFKFKDLYNMLKIFEKENTFISDQCIYNTYLQLNPPSDVTLYSYYSKYLNGVEKELKGIIHFGGDNKKFIKDFYGTKK